jgi:type VI secretion system protein ImpK
MSDDPFAESPEEATVVRPMPGGRPSAVPGAARGPAPKAPPGPVLPLPAVGRSPLLAAAAPLLATAIRIGERGSHPDPDQLRLSMVDAVREFEGRALATGLDTRSLRAARYALCATIDDLVLSTPWGSHSSWTSQSLTSTFHNEVFGGERFFEILEQMQRDLGRHSEVVELMYLCTSLGFEGRYRVMSRGIAALTELRDGVYRTIRQRIGDFERELSPHWHGVPAAHMPLSQSVPLWAIALGTVAAACLIYLGFNFSLAGSSDVAFAQLAGLPPKGAIVVPRIASAPVPPPPPIPVAVHSVHKFLEPEIKEGLVQVFEDAQATTVRLMNRNMFPSGEATLNPSYLPLIARIGQALESEPGEVIVNGYTDNQPIRTVRFPSNFQLSQARADAVAKLLAAHLSKTGRVHAEGKGDSDPIAPNNTPEGRQQNRRTDIVLTRAASNQ